jgi:hypothetical protein
MCRIILEGPDGVGKTTLGLKLSSVLGLGYYRKRTRADMQRATIDPLAFMKDCILDRSWMTDLVYSRVMHRIPGIGRREVYHAGLLAARSCALYLTLIPQGVLSGSYQTELRRLYDVDPHNRIGPAGNGALAHWSLPETAIFMNEKPGDEEVKSIIDRYKENAKAVDSCPSNGKGAHGPCQFLIRESPTAETGLIYDLLFCVGIKPKDVHIYSGLEAFGDELEDYFKPMMHLEIGKLPVPLKVECFEECVAEFSAICDKVGIKRERHGLEPYYLT